MNRQFRLWDSVSKKYVSSSTLHSKGTMFYFDDNLDLEMSTGKCDNLQHLVYENDRVAVLYRGRFLHYGIVVWNIVTLTWMIEGSGYDNYLCDMGDEKCGYSIIVVGTFHSRLDDSKAKKIIKEYETWKTK